jgi:hypothetical protein
MRHKRSIFLALLFTLFTFHYSAFTQTVETKRRISLAVTEGEPVSGYLIKSDADNIEIETPDGKRVIVSLDNVTMIVVSRKTTNAVSTAPTDPTRANIERLKRQVDRLDAKIKAADAETVELNALERDAQLNDRIEALRGQLRDSQSKEVEIQ